MKITSEIFQVGGGNLSSSEDAAIYLINFTDQAALVDAGCGNSMRRVVANIEMYAAVERIRYIFLTHCHYDHTGGASALRDLTGAQIVAHQLDAKFLEEGDKFVTAASWYGQSLDPLVIDVKLGGNHNEIDLSGRTVEAIHIPGHSPGSVVYLLESDGKKVLFAQDVHGPLHPSLLSDKENYLRSLDLLLSLNADILCEGHYGVFRGKKEVSGFIKGFMG